MRLSFAGLIFRELQISLIFVDFIFADAGNESTWSTIEYQETLSK